jgi:nitroreductase
MNLQEAINSRRSLRSLAEVNISDNTVSELALTAQLAPSCYNKQPWRFVFVKEKGQLDKVKAALSKGNEWAYRASMIIAVFSQKSFDCIMPDGREYYEFDTGMASALLMLKATELGLVAHPIAGYDQEKTRQILSLPQDAKIITLLIVGKHATGTEGLSDYQVQAEKNRPERAKLSDFVFMDRL